MLSRSLVVAFRNKKVKMEGESILTWMACGEFHSPTCHASSIILCGRSLVTCYTLHVTRQHTSCPVLPGAWHVIGHWQSWTQTWGGLCQGPTCQSVSALSPPRTMGWCCPVRRGQGRPGQGHPGRALPLLSTAGLPCMPSNFRQVRKDDVCAALHATTL